MMQKKLTISHPTTTATETLQSKNIFIFQTLHAQHFRNDLRKILEESDDNPSTSYTVDTTKSFSKPTTTTTTVAVTKSTTITTLPPPPPPSTTTPSSTSTYSTSPAPTTVESTSTIKSTTSRTTTKRSSYSLWKTSDDVPKTPKTYFSNSFSAHYNSPNKNNQISGQTNAKSPFKIVTKRPSGGHDSSTTASTPFLTPTINPFYYGFNRLPRFSTSQSKTSVKTTTPHQQNTSTRNSYFTSTKKPELLAQSTTTTTTIISEVDNNHSNYQSENPRSDVNHVSQTEKPKSSSTYNPVFDIYFKQIARQRTASP